MIKNAEEFVTLRKSSEPAEYQRAANEPAALNVWLEVIDRFPEMRIWVAHNKTVPTEVLTVLARDPDTNVRASVAMKNKLSGKLFDLLVHDPEPEVRERVVYNKNAPKRILEILENDPYEQVSHQARERLNQM